MADWEEAEKEPHPSLLTDDENVFENMFENMFEDMFEDMFERRHRICESCCRPLFTQVLLEPRFDCLISLAVASPDHGTASRFDSAA